MYGYRIDTSAFEFGWTPEAVSSSLGLGGIFLVECYDSEGNLRWRDTAKNIIPLLALNDVLNVYYAQGAQTGAFYIGMVDNVAFSAFSASDTMTSHPGWQENVATSNGSRPQWIPGTASGATMINPSFATITMNASAVIHGFFLSSSNTLNGTAGNLTATAALTQNQSCNSGDVLKVQYQINGTTT